MPKPFIIVISFITLFLACGYTVCSQKTATKKISGRDSLNIRLKANIDFFGQRLLKGHTAIIHHYISRYQNDTCGVVAYKNSDLKAHFEGVKAIKGIRRGSKIDHVFVIPPFNHCDEGESYCFYNPTLPRLYTESDCCHPQNLFVLPDIDEDGIKEIGIYYSSCSSRYKGIRIFSLKRGRWQEIADATFDVLTKDPDKVHFEQLVKKIAKGKFRICSFMDGKTTWNTVTMKRSS